MPAGIPGSAASDLLNLIEGRRSIRRYTSEELPAALLEQLLTAVTWAPSAHNRQPTRIIVLDDLQWKVRLAKAMGERLRNDRRQDRDDEARIEQDVARSHARITGAPIVLVLCLDMAPMDHYPDAARQQAEYLMAVQSVAMGAQNLLLMAHAHGLGACWMCAPLFCPSTVRSALELPANLEPQALITLGWPANGGKPPSRRPFAEITRYAGVPTQRSGKAAPSVSTDNEP